MLVLCRKVGEEIVICNQIRLRITSIEGKRVRLGITAPSSVKVLRAELDPLTESYEAAGANGTECGLTVKSLQEVAPLQETA